MKRLINSLIMKLQSRKGQGTVEYALATLAVVIIIAAVLLPPDNPLKTAIKSAFEAASTQITNATSTTGGTTG